MMRYYCTTHAAISGNGSFLCAGTAVFACQGPEGLWDLKGPDLSNCTSTWINIINQKVKEQHTHTQTLIQTCANQCVAVVIITLLMDCARWSLKRTPSETY